jgi:hypothetical protein
VQPDRHIGINANADGQLVCTACGEDLPEDEMALLLRRKRGASFDPLCIVCARTVIRWALTEAEIALFTF